MNQSDAELVEMARMARDRVKHPITHGQISFAIGRYATAINNGRHHEIEEARHDLRLIARISSGLQPIETAPKDRYILVAGDSGYMGTPLRFEPCKFSPTYREGHQWRNYANDSFRDSGGPATYWMELPEMPQKEET